LAKLTASRRASSRLKRPIAICRWQRRSPLAGRPIELGKCRFNELKKAVSEQANPRHCRDQRNQ
jgi:hypothetical protein